MTRLRWGVSTTLPMLRRSARNRWASPARSNGKALATTGASRPAAKSASSGFVILSMPPSRRHQLSRLRPKTPRFWFSNRPAFHQGMVEVGSRIRLLNAARRLRPLSFSASDNPYMINRPPGRRIR
jgi:hypothetical protein